eukprot:TRINITY_DN24986_c0_g1_i1.p1 TRINITY_DN24986_c0_g1~~TRINITY_DN24986_c0_g1_i1.p1  ORF type:complete len:244 (+),score=23.31 TRINITY_DN24986_c0_g1_i1:212-943(+)
MSKQKDAAAPLLPDAEPAKAPASPQGRIRGQSQQVTQVRADSGTSTRARGATQPASPEGGRTRGQSGVSVKTGSGDEEEAELVHTAHGNSEPDQAEKRGRGWSRAGESQLSIDDRVATSGGEDAEYADDWGTDNEPTHLDDFGDKRQSSAERASAVFGTYVPLIICLAGSVMIGVGIAQLAADQQHIAGGGRLVGFGCFLLFSGIPFLIYLFWVRIVGPCVDGGRQKEGGGGDVEMSKSKPAE